MRHRNLLGYGETRRLMQSVAYGKTFTRWPYKLFPTREEAEMTTRQDCFVCAGPSEPELEHEGWPVCAPCLDAIHGPGYDARRDAAVERADAERGDRGPR